MKTLNDFAKQIWIDLFYIERPIRSEIDRTTVLLEEVACMVIDRCKQVIRDETKGSIIMSHKYYLDALDELKEEMQ